jgi:hypothetical protein
MMDACSSTCICRFIIVINALCAQISLPIAHQKGTQTQKSQYVRQLTTTNVELVKHGYTYIYLNFTLYHFTSETLLSLVSRVIRKTSVLITDLIQISLTVLREVDLPNS